MNLIMTTLIFLLSLQILLFQHNKQLHHIPHSHPQVTTVSLYLPSITNHLLVLPHTHSHHHMSQKVQNDLIDCHLLVKNLAILNNRLLLKIALYFKKMIKTLLKIELYLNIVTIQLVLMLLKIELQPNTMLVLMLLKIELHPNVMLVLMLLKIELHSLHYIKAMLRQSIHHQH